MGLNVVVGRELGLYVGVDVDVGVGVDVEVDVLFGFPLAQRHAYLEGPWFARRRAGLGRPRTR